MTNTKETSEYIFDKIDDKLEFYMETFKKAPDFLVLDLISYALLIEELGEDPSDEVKTFNGFEILVKQTDEGLVDFISKNSRTA